MQTSVKEYAGTNLKQAHAATRTYVWKIHTEDPKLNFYAYIIFFSFFFFMIA